MDNRITAIFLLGCWMIITGCRSADSSQAALDQGLALFRQVQIEEALPHFQRAVALRTDNAEAHIWLAETHRRLQETAKAIEHARIAIDLEPCNTFALTVMADASVPAPGDADPAETSWNHLLRAIECDATDGNVWESQWGFAIRRNEPEMMRQSLQRMVETGFLTDAALSFGRWLISTLPENAMLITNGDMDTYPAMAVQQAEGIRTDVTVVERGLLDMPWGIRFQRDHGGVPIPFPDEELDLLRPVEGAGGTLVRPSDRIFQHWVEETRARSNPRPIALAATVYREFFQDVEGDLQFAGPFSLLKGGPVAAPNDTTALRRSLEGIAPGDFVGPWVSEQDYSPVRGLYTRNIVRSVTHSALVYVDELTKAGRLEEAREMLDWAEEFEKSTELGVAYWDRIAELRARLSE